MIDPISSLAAALEALAGADPVTEPGSSDPDFLQVLQAIAGPQPGSSPPGSKLVEAIAAAARTMPNGGKVAQGILSGLQKLAFEDREGMRPEGDKELQNDSQTAIEMVLALLSVTSPEVKPSTEGPMIGGTRQVGIESAADLVSNTSPSTAVEIAGVPFMRRAQEIGTLATDTRSPAEPTSGGSQSHEAAGPWRKPAHDTATVVLPSSFEPAVSASLQGAETLATGSRTTQVVHGEAPHTAISSQVASATQSPAHHRQPALPNHATGQSDPAGMEDMLKTGKAPDFIEQPGEAKSLQNGPAKAGTIPGPAADEPFDRQPSLVGNSGNAQPAQPGLAGAGPILAPAAVSDRHPASWNGSSKQGGLPETYPNFGAVQQASGPAVTGLQAVATEGPSATLPGALLVEQIVRQAHIFRAQGETGLDIQLEPKELGKVRVFVRLGSDGLHVKLEAESSHTRGMLQAALPQIREALENQGLKVDRFDLALGAGSSGFGSLQDQTSHPRMNGGHRSGPYSWEENAASEPDRAPSLQPSSSLVDYRI